MSISTAIENAQERVADCYTSVDTMGGTLPETQNLANLPAAIESIPSGSGDTIYLENKSGETITANKKVLCNLSAAISEPQEFTVSGSTVFNPLCVYDNDNFVATFQSGMESVLFSDGGLKEITQSTSSLSYLAGYRNNIVYHPNGVISSAMASGWTGQNCYIISGLNTLVTIPSYCQYLGSYDGTHYVFDRREGYHSIKTYDINTNTIGTEVVSVPDVNFLYYGMMSGNKIFVYKYGYYAIYSVSGTTATLLYSGSVSDLAPLFMTGVGVGEYIISLTNYSAYYDIANNGNKPSCLRVHRINNDYTLERVHPKELEMFETTPCYLCYDNRSNILSIGTHNNAYFYMRDSNGFSRINVVFDKLPNNNGYAYRAYMTPNKNKVIIEGKNNEYYFYDVKYPKQFISVDSSLNYDNESNITGYATGTTSSGKYEVSTVLPNVSNVSLDFGMYAAPDELSAYGNAGAITNSEKVYQIPAYDNVPFKLICRKEGYYDKVWDNLSYPWDLPVVSGSTYSTYTAKNLTYALDDVMTISIPSGELPDKSVCDNIIGCLGTIGGGQCYNNFTKVGSPYINKKTGLATNFSTSNYLTKELDSLGNNWEIYCKITTAGTTITTGQKIFTIGTADSSTLYVKGYVNWAGTKMWWAIGSFFTDQFDISNSTTYYFKLGCDGEKTYVYMSTTGYDSMTLVKEESTVISIPAYTMFLGYNLDTVDNKGAFGGMYDLSQTYIKVNGSVYWTAAINKYAVNGNGYDNFIKVGSVTVNNSTGNATNFSQSNYISVPLNANNITSFDLIAKGRISSTSDTCTIVANDKLIVKNGYLATWYSGSYTQGSTLMSTSQDYWYRLVYDGTNRKGYILQDNSYTLDTLPDISQWSQEFSITQSWSSYWATLNIGAHLTNSAEYFRGTLYLSGFNFTCNGNQFWSPRSIVQAIGLLPSGVTDDGSAQTWNLFYDNGEFLADTTSPMTGYSWCGSVAVPAHGVPTPPSHNFTVIGSLSESDGVYSGFGDDDYIELDTNLLVAGYTYIFKVTTGNDLSYFQNILAPDGWFELYVEDGYLQAWSESAYSNILSGAVNAETTYWVKLETTNNNITLSYSTDGTNYTGAVTTSCVAIGAANNFNIGHGILDYVNRNWNGSIDMANSHIYYNGNTIW